MKFRKCLAVLIGLALTATGLWAAGAEEESAVAAEREMVLDPTTGEMVTAPEYGGTMTVWGALGLLNLLVTPISATATQP